MWEFIKRLFGYGKPEPAFRYDATTGNWDNCEREVDRLNAEWREKGRPQL